MPENVSNEKKRCSRDTLCQFMKFGIVGVSNTVISYVLNVMVLKWMEPLAVSWDYIVGNIVGFVISVAWSFYWNSRFVFKAKRKGARRTLQGLLKAYMAYGFTGVILNNVLSGIMIHVWGISKYIAPLLNLIVSVPLNFVINKYWTFKAVKM